MQIVAMASGTGTNFRAICEAIKVKGIDAEIIGLIVDKPNIKALDVAREYKIKTYVIDYKQINNRELYNQELLTCLTKLSPDLICLAGYMRIINSEVIKKFNKRIVNIHPSLLPKYPGLHAIEQAYEAGELQTGVTTHFVDEGMDTGPIIKQASFSIENLELEEIFEVLKPIEHQLYIDTLKEVIGELK